MQFLKSYDLKTIKTKFKIIFYLILFNLMIIIFLSNILIYFGAYGISSRPITTNLVLLFIEGIIPAIILYWENKRISQATSKQLAYSNILINVVIFMALFVDLFYSYLCLKLLF